MYNVHDNINDFLISNNNECVIFCVANNAVFDMTKNLVISATNNNIDIVLFALDEDIVENMKDSCHIVKYYFDGLGNTFNNKKFCKYGTNSFQNVIFQRFFIGNEILKMNKYYIYIDTDIVIYDNFVNDILCQYKNNNYDMLSQYNGKDCCTGFYSMKPNDKTISINEDFFKKHDYISYKTNQPFINKYLLEDKILNIKFLNRDLYPNGKWFYPKTNKIKKKCKIIHFNCITGYLNKINKMKQHDSWYL